MRADSTNLPHRLPKTSDYRVDSKIMAMNSTFTSVSIGRGVKPCATELAITRMVAINVTKTTRITKTSIKTITIR
jgi:hypothetical protein